MKALEQNIFEHENGMLYFVVKRQGRLVRRSLRTKNIGYARQLIREEGIQKLIARKKSSDSISKVITEEKALIQASVSVTLDEHDRKLVLLSTGTKEMAARGRRAIEKYCESWETFSPIEVWNAYRRSGLKRQGKELTSAANHLRWYMRKLVPWLIRQKLVSESVGEEMTSIPKIKIPSRRIRVPEPQLVNEFLEMIATEDREGSAFLRFLAATGLRRSGACELTWKQVDFTAGTMEVRQKGGRVKVIPLSTEALEILQKQKEIQKVRPWPYGIKEIEVLERRMKRFAKGFDIDLTTFHSFRHYFASRALMSGLTVQEVADLLGHSDGGVLVLRTYGHICSARLKNAVTHLRLTA